MVRVSPDGKNVYVVASYSNSIVTFTRSLTTGALYSPSSIVNNNGDTKLNGAWSVAVSPDGKNVYVVAAVSNSIVTFTRSLSTGALSSPSSIVNNNGDTKLDYACGVVVSPDGKNVYVVASYSDSIVTFTRSLTTGALSSPSSIVNNNGDTKLDYAYGVAVSPDGKNVYAVASYSDSIVTFTRSLTTGALSSPSSIVNNDGDTKLNIARGVAVSPDGKNVYVVAAGSDSIVTFNRSLSTGALSSPSSIVNNNGDTKLDYAYGVAVSPDGKNVYAVAYYSDSIVTFERPVSRPVDLIKTGISETVIIGIVSSVSIVVLAIVLLVLWKRGLLKKCKKNSTHTDATNSQSSSLTTVKLRDLHNDV